MKKEDLMVLGLAGLAVFFIVRTVGGSKAAPATGQRAAASGGYDTDTWSKVAKMWGAGGTPSAQQWGAVFPFSYTGF